MKKTLIALAALAATGATFAQVTITGNVTAGYQQKTLNTGWTGSAPAGNRAVTQSSTSGFGVDTAEVVFTAKEDLGGGQSVEAKMGLENVFRGATASAATTGTGPSDVTVSYTNTSFGRISFANERGAAILSGTASAGAPVIAMDDKLFERRTVGEKLTFATKLGPVAVGYQYGEATDGVGLGAGTSGAATVVDQRTNTIFAAYDDNGMKIEGFYRAYDNEDGDNAVGKHGGISKKSALGFNLGYDFGVAKAGFGYIDTTASVGPKVNYMQAGLTVPMGALTLGATYGSSRLSGISDVALTSVISTQDAAGQAGLRAGLASANPLVVAGTNATLAGIRAGFAAADGTATGWSLGAKYDLSKRTSVVANYAAWTRAGYSQLELLLDTPAGAARNTAISILGYGPIETQANVMLSHSF